jgi:hypothetical protein
MVDVVVDVVVGMGWMWGERQGRWMMVNRVDQVQLAGEDGDSTKAENISHHII